MINPFIMHSAITESVSRVSIEPYQFIGDLSGSTFNEACDVVSVEALGICETYTRTDELISEAVARGCDSTRINIMVENVFDSMIDGLKKVWAKLVEVIKGLILKIKAFFLRITGQTGKWLDTMKTKIETTKNENPRSSSAKAEMHEWDSDVFKKIVDSTRFTTDTVPQAVTAGLDQIKDILDNIKTSSEADTSTQNDYPYDDTKYFDSLDGASRLGSNPTQVKDAQNNRVSWKITKGADGKDATSAADKAKNEKIISDTTKATEKLEKDYDKYLKDMYNQISSDYGVSGKDMNTVLSSIKSKAYGVKKTVNYGSKVDDMLKVIDGTKEMITTVSDAYQKKLDQIQNEVNAIDDIKSIADNITVGNNAYAPFVSAMKSNCTAVINGITNLRTSENKFYNKLKSIAVQAIKDRSQEYMKVLTKFANTKNFATT